jgi:AcrR family transcriptional regulator
MTSSPHQEKIGLRKPGQDEMGAQQIKRARVQIDQIVEAATEEFLKRGYHRATISAIVKRIGGSNRNIYDYFGDKFGLYRAVITAYRDRMLSAISAVPLRGTGLRDHLLSFATGYLRSCLEPQAIAMHRLVVSEAHAFPELGDSVLGVAEGALTQRLATLLTEHRAQGEIAIADPALGAGMFLALVRGEHHLRASYGPVEPLSEPQLQMLVDASVDLFLLGIISRTNA